MAQCLQIHLRSESWTTRLTEFGLLLDTTSTLLASTLILVFPASLVYAKRCEIASPRSWSRKFTLIILLRVARYLGPSLEIGYVPVVHTARRPCQCGTHLSARRKRFGALSTIHDHARRKASHDDGRAITGNTTGIRRKNHGIGVRSVLCGPAKRGGSKVIGSKAQSGLDNWIMKDAGARHDVRVALV
ncbi:hypothetical protein PLICRDRAFT_201529 [Plicaturopsis crispa FD-325 SS-3]|nr:hypothetical protein PLICRDRAFT_201529 [Plicaturopsis crispa FD-325 SS-3]